MSISSPSEAIIWAIKVYLFLDTLTHWPSFQSNPKLKLAFSPQRFNGLKSTFVCLKCFRVMLLSYGKDRLVMAEILSIWWMIIYPRLILWPRGVQSIKATSKQMTFSACLFIRVTILWSILCKTWYYKTQTLGMEMNVVNIIR